MASQRNRDRQQPVNLSEAAMKRRTSLRSAVARISVAAGAFLVLLAGAARATPPTTEFLAESQQVLNAEKKLAKKGQTMVTGILKCHRKTILDASKGIPYDATKLATCLANVKTKWLNAVATFVPRNREVRATTVFLPQALSETGGAEGAFDALDIELKRAAGKLYCCGSEPLPGDFSGQVPDPTTDPLCKFSNFDKANKALQRLATDLLKCHLTLITSAFTGKTFSLDSCEAQAESGFNGRVDKVPGLPLCAQAAVPLHRRSVTSIADDLFTLFRTQAAQVASEGTVRVATVGNDTPGCCETDAFHCKDVASAASCAGNFVAVAVCDVGGQCQPNNCRDTAICAGGSGLSCRNCEESCGPCTPFCGDGRCNGSEGVYTCPVDCPPVCGDGFCQLLESCSTCSLDCSCGPSCGNGTCEAPGENHNNCPSDCSAACGNHVCESGENANTCSTDCTPTCGNHACEAGESTNNCPLDCPPVCGNHVCETGEHPSTCATDCVPPSCYASNCYNNSQQNCCVANCCQSDSDCVASGMGDRCNITPAPGFPYGCCYFQIG